MSNRNEDTEQTAPAHIFLIELCSLLLINYRVSFLFAKQYIDTNICYFIAASCSFLIGRRYGNSGFVIGQILSNMTLFNL